MRSFPIYVFETAKTVSRLKPGGNMLAGGQGIEVGQATVKQVAAAV